MDVLSHRWLVHDDEKLFAGVKELFGMGLLGSVLSPAPLGRHAFFSAGGKNRLFSGWFVCFYLKCFPWGLGVAVF